MEGSSRQYLPIRIEVLVVFEVGREEPVPIVVVVSGTKHVDDRCTEVVERGSADAGGLNPIESSRIDLGDYGVSFCLNGCLAVP